MRSKGLQAGTPAVRGALLGLTVLIVLLVGACSNKEHAADAGSSAADPAAVPGVSNRKGSFLAYEHDVSIRLKAADIVGNLAAARDACMSERFGTCSVLNEELGAGEEPFGTLKFRADPKAVQPLVQIAAHGGEIAQRSSHADDLADAVRDNGLRRERLQVQHKKLSELLDRRDAKIQDVIALTQQLTEIEAELQSTEQEAAQQQRRIETNLVTLHFSSTGVTAESSKIRQALRGLGGTWDASVAAMITVAGALLPFALVIGLVWWIVRFFGRRNRRRLATQPGTSMPPE